ncbi:MAG: cytochrome c biogenesis protein CcsA [Bacteroidales bacterium]
MKIFKKLSFLTGMPFFGILLMIMIIAMALATFIESAQGTNAAWAVIYDTWWFEALFVLVLINLVGNIVRYKMYKRSKIAVFIFHISLIFMIIGGGITRYFSNEGMMHIREGNVSNTIISNKTFMDVRVTDETSELTDAEEVRLSVLTPRKFKWRGELNGKKIRIRSVDYINNAVAQYVPTPGGEPYVQLVILAGRQITAGLVSGKEVAYPGITISFNMTESEADLRLFSDGDGLTGYSDHPVSIVAMGGAETQNFTPGEAIPFEQAKLFTLNGVRLALQRYMPSAKLQFVKSGGGGQTSGLDAVKLEVELDGMKSELSVQGRSNTEGELSSVQMGSTNIACRFGSKNIQLPFVLRLEDFRIDRYPGSNSPSSFESDVVLIDMERDINEMHNIYMNNVLKHRGYRFYQSSYDQDEKGTILSVKKDFAGTVISYAGYLLLVVGMLLALVMKGTRFSAISRASARAAKTAAVLLVFLLSGTTLFAQAYPTPSREQAEEFGKLWVQGKEGRFKPMNTLSNEIMRKVVKKSKLDEKGPDQVLLGMIVYPDIWKQAPLFEVEHPELHQMLGFKGTHVSFNDFIRDGRYILSEVVNEAYKKRVQERTDLDKDVMKLDEKINVFYMVQTGAFLKIFPDPEAEDGSWLAVSDLLEHDHTVTDTLGQVFLLYTRALREKDNELASEIISFIAGKQEHDTLHELHPGKKRAEILYNRINIFQRLVRMYGIFGITLLFLQFMRIFRPRKWVEYMYKVGVIHLVAFFTVHTVFFGVRWFISGYAPLSNGYESMIFVAWITMLSGLIFARRTGFALALTAILAALSLMVAHMSWMNPDITNLVPVLKSPWLTIHVSVIMAGYGFLGLGMLMGLINLVFFTILNLSNRKRISGVVNQLTRVNHQAVIIGLYFLTIGSFLGGIWANESWGRYWGWDPKETWSLISILVYSFIVHMHRFPGMKGTYAFNLASLMGYFSILMTYFGVNYFLGGIHSYAGGASFTIPSWIFIVVLAIFALAAMAYQKQKIFNGDYLEEQ